MTILPVAEFTTCSAAQRRPRGAKVHRSEEHLGLHCVLWSCFANTTANMSCAIELLPAPFAGLTILYLQNHVYLTRTVIGGLIPLAEALRYHNKKKNEYLFSDMGAGRRGS